MPESSTASEPAIHTEALTKTYRYTEQQPGLAGAVRGLFRPDRRERLAVDSLQLTVPRGQIIGLLGPNGAGKTTTIKMLCGLLRPTSGELEVLGHRPARRGYDFLSRISVVFGQKSMLWWDVSTYDSLLIHREMYAIPKPRFDHTVADLAERLQVTDILNIPVRKLSLGQRMRCELILALLHGPDLLFADEPTVGLDVVAKLSVRTFLAELNRDLGTTIVLTSHDMNDVAALCERVAVINHGRTIFDGDLIALRSRADAGIDADLDQVMSKLFTEAADA
jgi:ABC-2 type transport system ATP-binding protein